MKRNRCLLFVLLALCLLLLPSCKAGPDPTFVEASRATHDAVAPEYRRYVDADQALTPEQRTRRHASIDRWNEAITSREVRR